MKLEALFSRWKDKLEPQPCIVEDIAELGKEEYATLYHDLIWHRGNSSEYDNPAGYRDGRYRCILILEEAKEDGILLLSDETKECAPYALISHARSLLDAHIRQLADYAVSESTEHSEDGRWSISYEELYHHFGANITDSNGNGKLLQKELQQREEINELLMTEDCIEMTCHLEYCENCQQGGLAGAMSLLSLMGCNLNDAHFQDEASEHDGLPEDSQQNNQGISM